MGSIFDILGPVMVGPSSSHTAGAVRIGLIGRKILGRQPKRANIYLHGSFAATGEGHGTGRGIVAGLLGMKPDDMRIPDSYEIAETEGMEFNIEKKELRDAHPNTALMVLEADGVAPLKIQACSIGGGRIRVTKLDGMDVNFSAETNTLIVYNLDQPGCVADVANVLSRKKINIATMQLFRDKRGGYAVMVVETDQVISRQALDWLESMDGILKVTFIDVAGEV
ncbi:MAG: L-serine ammonia-lyase, iron-sulfur-dependent subunit beta [Eubacteriales bacterium]|nr:L-serine ammonia-lyase, iron-sulfur-dependent subunit beta [Eubacteriales bacterium]